MIGFPNYSNPTILIGSAQSESFSTTVSKNGWLYILARSTPSAPCLIKGYINDNEVCSIYTPVTSDYNGMQSSLFPTTKGDVLTINVHSGQIRAVFIYPFA